MCSSMYEAVEDYESSSDFMEVNVPIQRQNYRQTHFSHSGNAMSEHKD